MVKLENVGARAVLALALLAFLPWGTGCNMNSSAAPAPTPTPTPTPVAHSVGLAWDASSSGNLQGYEVFRSQTSGVYGSSSISGMLSTSTLQFTDSSVLGGQTYFYVLKSIDVNGLESPPSSEVSATVPSP